MELYRRKCSCPEGMEEDAKLNECRCTGGRAFIKEANGCFCPENTELNEAGKCQCIYSGQVYKQDIGDCTCPAGLVVDYNSPTGCGCPENRVWDQGEGFCVTEKRKLIFDTDMCSDDVIALILALQSEVEILAITAVAGDVSLK